MRLFFAGLAALLFFLASTPVFCAIKATLLLEHDGSSPWTEMLREGLAKGARDFGMDTEVVILPPGPGQREGFRDAAARSDLVIVASDNLHEALRDNAANFRRVKFGCVDAGIRAPNIMSVTFADEQAAFLAGVAAAMTAAGKAGPRPPVIGWLSGMDTPAMRSLYNGFVEGARLARPDCRVIQAVAGSFADGKTASAKAAWLRENGARVIVLATGAALPPVSPDVPVILLDRSDGREALGTINKAVDKAIYEIMASMASGKFRGKEIIIYNLENGGTDFQASATNHNIERRLKELREELKKGSIHVKSLRARTLCDCLD